MTAIFDISMGGADVARAFMSLTSGDEVVIDVVEGDAHVKLISSDVKKLVDMIACHLISKHGEKKLEVREAQPAQLPEFERKFRKIKDELLQCFRK